MVSWQFESGNPRAVHSCFSPPVIMTGLAGTSESDKHKIRAQFIMIHHCFFNDWDLIHWFTARYRALIRRLMAKIGIIRMPDFFLRMHACSIIETLGVFFLSIGMILLSGISLNSLKIILLLLVIFFVSPTVSHIISQAAKHHSSPSGEQ